MRAQIICIESGSSYPDGDRRFMLKFLDGTGLYDVVRLPERAFGLIGLTLDSEMEVTFAAMKVIPIDAPGVAAMRYDAEMAKGAGE